MCLVCDNVKKFVNANVIIYDNTTASVIKNYSYPDATVTLKITAGGYRGDSHILMGMLELKGLKYCPNCGKKIEDFGNCESKENDKISCEIEKLKRDIEDLKKDLEVKEPKSAQFMMYEHLAHKAIAERESTKRYRDIVNLYERLAKGGIECSMTVDDKNGTCHIYSPGIELDDHGKRINESFEDALEENE